MAKVNQSPEGQKNIVLNKGENAIVFGDEGIYQVLSDSFMTMLKEARETQGHSILHAFDTCGEGDAVKIINDFVLIQVVNLLEDITTDLRNKDLRGKK